MNEIKVDNNILFFAFRYALGRKSSAPSIVMTNIIKNLEKIDDSELERYILEIDECKDFGMEVDKNNWMNLRKEMQSELDLRGTLSPEYKI